MLAPLASKTQITNPTSTDLVTIVRAGAVNLVAVSNLIPTAVTGVFIDVEAAPYNCVPTSVATDSTTATNNTTAIQAAITAAQVSGGRVFFRRRYRTNATITVSGDGVKLVGFTESSSGIDVAAASTFDAVVFSRTGGTASGNDGSWGNGNGIEDFGITRAGAASTLDAGLKVAYQNYFTAKNVYIYNFGIGYYEGPQIFCTFENITITGNANTVSPIMYGFYLTHTLGGAASNHFINCRFTSDFPGGHGGTSAINSTTVYGWYLFASASGRSDAGIQDSFFTECESTSATYGLAIDGTGTGSTFEDFDVHFNGFYSGDGATCSIQITSITAGNHAAIDFNGGIADHPTGVSMNGCSGVIIRGLQFANNTTVSVQMVNCVNCQVQQCLLYSAGGSEHLVMSNCSYCRIDNNTFVGAIPGVVLITGSVKNSISNNVFNGTTTGQAVSLASGCNNNVVNANITPNGASDIANSGTGNVVANTV